MKRIKIPMIMNRKEFTEEVFSGYDGGRHKCSTAGLYSISKYKDAVYK